MAQTLNGNSNSLASHISCEKYLSTSEIADQEIKGLLYLQQKLMHRQVQEILDTWKSSFMLRTFPSLP